MKDIGKKLAAGNGAAMLLALLFFLLCSLIGTIILGAAYANAGKLLRTRQEEQSYLAVRSAAQLVIDDLTDHPFVGVYQARENYVETRTSNAAGALVVEIKNYLCFSKPSLGGSFTGSGFGSFYEDEFTRLFLNHASYRGKDVLHNVSLIGTDGFVGALDLDGSNHSGSYPEPAEIKVSFRMKLDGYPDVPEVDVKISFQTGAANRYQATVEVEDNNQNRVVLTSLSSIVTTATAQPEQTVKNTWDIIRRETTTDCVTTISWAEWEAVPEEVS